jgi:hypothetical protein
MKNAIKNFALLTLLTLCALNTNAQATSKTFSKAFNLDGSTLVQLDLPGMVEVKTWDNPTIRFVITVTLPSGNSNLSVIDQLSTVGRYDLELTTLNGNTMIEAKNLKRTIKIKGQDFKENVHFVILAPKNITIETGQTNAVAEVKK